MHTVQSPQGRPFQVLLESPSLLIVNKPCGIPFHNSLGQPGFINLLRAQIPVKDCPRLHATHRLDTATSGPLIVAKTSAAAKEIIDAFRNRRVHKYYVALTERKPVRKQGSVIGDMTKSRQGNWMLLRSLSNPAITRFSSTAVPGRPGLRAFLLKPETGKTHQLRVAMKSLGSPVLGDVRYSHAHAAKRHERTYLHCAALRFMFGNELLQVLCRPEQGEEFVHEGFMSLFDDWFPQDYLNKCHWFSNSKLLRSCLEDR
jgi:tRNA pseudouridine32 synthase/23S rRNA pseudouridine746 synthase